MDPADCVTFLTRLLDAEQHLATKAKTMRYDLPTDAPWEQAHILADRVGGDSSAVAVHRVLAVFSNPDRVLAEVRVRRRILDLHGLADVCDAHDAAYRSIPCDTLLALAQLYTDQPGWRPEWHLDDWAGATPELPSQAISEAETGKLCAFCGRAGTVLSWRLSKRASSPLTKAKWWPTKPVYEAKLTCPQCRCASYGWLVAAEPQDLTGEFLIADHAELKPW